MSERLSLDQPLKVVEDGKKPPCSVQIVFSAIVCMSGEGKDVLCLSALVLESWAQTRQRQSNRLGMASKLSSELFAGIWITNLPGFASKVELIF